MSDNAKNREDWVAKKLRTLRGNILDVGAGDMPYKKYCEHLTYVSQDAGLYYPDETQPGLQNTTWACESDLTCDAVDIPCPRGFFDNVLCTELLEHVPRPIWILQEIGRIVRVGGKVILTAPFCSLVHQAPHYYYSGFSRHWYEYFLPQCGLEILEISHNGDYVDWLNQELERSECGYNLPPTAKIHLTARLGGTLCFGWHVFAERIPCSMEKLPS